MRLYPSFCAYVVSMKLTPSHQRNLPVGQHLALSHWGVVSTHRENTCYIHLAAPRDGLGTVRSSAWKWKGGVASTVAGWLQGSQGQTQDSESTL